MSREVVAHLAEVYDHKVMAMRLGRRPEEGEWVTDEPFRQEHVEWFEDEHAKLLAELTGARADGSGVVVVGARPDASDSGTGAWHWRPSCIALMSRHSSDRPSAIDAELAVDGIDEVLTLMLGGEDEAAVEVPGTGTVNIARRRSLVVGHARERAHRGRAPRRIRRRTPSSPAILASCSSISGDARRSTRSREAATSRGSR